MQISDKSGEIGRRRAGEAIPAFILVGFLGSGKTTLLGRLISWCVANGLMPGLILNEIGAAWIDGEAVRREGLELTELSEGCVCCAADDELGPALTQMAENPKIDLILLEASGLADPADMLDALTDPSLWKTIEVAGIISVVDSHRFEALSAQTNLARRQVRYADVLVMNKCDLIDPDQRETLKTSLTEIAPRAHIFPAENGLPYAGIEAVLDYSLQVGRKRQQAQEQYIARALKLPSFDLKVLDGGENHNNEDGHNHSDEAHGHAHLSIHVASFDLEAPVDLILFEAWLRSLPKTVYRAKGFVKVKDSDLLHTFQHMPGYTKVLPLATYRPPALRGVFIGQDLDEAWLAMRLRDCQGQG